MKEDDKTRVIFRKFKKGGDIIAFMPDLPANLGMVESYMHIGQHGSWKTRGRISWPLLKRNNRKAPLNL